MYPLKCLCTFFAFYFNCVYFLKKTNRKIGVFSLLSHSLDACRSQGWARLQPTSASFSQAPKTQSRPPSGKLGLNMEAASRDAR